MIFKANNKRNINEIEQIEMPAEVKKLQHDKV